MPRRSQIIDGLLVMFALLWLACWQLQGPVRGTATCFIIAYLLLAAQAAIWPDWLASATDDTRNDGTIPWSRLGRILTIVGMHVGILLGALDVYRRMHLALVLYFAIGEATLDLFDLAFAIRQFVGHALTAAAVGGLIALLTGATLGRSFAVVIGGAVGWFAGIALCALSHDARSPAMAWIVLGWLVLGVLLGYLCRDRLAGFGRQARRWAGITTLPAFAFASWKWAAYSQYFVSDTRQTPTLTMLQQLERAWFWQGGSLTFLLGASGVLAGGVGAVVAAAILHRRTQATPVPPTWWRSSWRVAWTMAALLLAVSTMRLWRESRQNLELVATLPERCQDFAVGPKADPVVELAYRDLWQRRRGRHERSDNGKAVFTITRNLDSQPAAEIVVPVGPGDVIGSSDPGGPLVISRDGRRLAWMVTTRTETRDSRGRTFSTTSKIGVGDLETATLLAETEVSGHPRYLVLSPTGDRLAGWQGSQWVIYESDNMNELGRWGAGYGFHFPFKHVARPGSFSPDGTRFAHLVREGQGRDTVCRLDVRDVTNSRKLASTRLPEEGRWIAISFQDDSTIVLVGLKRCFAWKLDSNGRLRLTHSHQWRPKEFTCSALSQDGRVVIGRGIVPGHSYQPHAGHLLRLPDAEFLGRIPHSPDVHVGCSLSPDGTCFIQKAYTDELNVWRMAPHQVERLNEAAEK